MSMLLSVLIIPPISHTTLKCTEREAGKAVEDVARHRCDSVVTTERENLLGTHHKLYYECIKFYRSNVLKDYYKRGLIVRLFIIPVI